MCPRGPKGTDPQQAGRLLRGRASFALEEMGAAAAIAPPPEQAGPRGRFGGPTGPNAPDFTVAQRLDLPEAPSATANYDFMEFLFSASTDKYADLKEVSYQQ